MRATTLAPPLLSAKDEDTTRSDRLALTLVHPVLPPDLAALVHYFFNGQIWLWLEEFEAVYHLFEGWEMVAEQWNRYVEGWKLEGAQKGLEAEWRTEWLMNEVVVFVMLRRAYIRRYLPSSMPGTIEEFEKLRLKPLLRLHEVPAYTTLMGQQYSWHDLRSHASKALMKPQSFARSTAFDISNLPQPPEQIRERR
ncbi:hypothetical protein JCM11251_001130 [Rhodosporidiobolus azoricus]